MNKIIKRIGIGLATIALAIGAYKVSKPAIDSYIAKRNKTAVVKFQNSTEKDFKSAYAPRGFPQGTAWLTAWNVSGKRVVTLGLETGRTDHPDVIRNKVLVDIGDDGSLEGVLEGTNGPNFYPHSNSSSKYRPATQDEQESYIAFRNADTKSDLSKAAERIGVKSRFEWE